MQICKGVFEEGFNPVSRNAAFSRDHNRRSTLVVAAAIACRRSEIAIRINDCQRCSGAREAIAAVALVGQQIVRFSLVESEVERLPGVHQRLHSAMTIQARLLIAMKEEPDRNEGNRNAARAKNKQELAALTIDQGDPANRHYKIDQREEYITPVRTQI